MNKKCTKGMLHCFLPIFISQFAVINQEKTVQNIEKFDRDTLKHAETQEKQSLPTKEGKLFNSVTVHIALDASR